MDTQTLTALGGKLNIGCGPNYKPGYVNIDCYPGVVCDVLGDIFALPFATGTVAAIYLGHVLEHLPFQDVARALLECRRVLKPGAPLCVVGPDVNRTGHLSPEHERWIVYGTGSHDADVHLWGCTEALVCRFVREAGFALVVAHACREATVNREWDVLQGPLTDAQCIVTAVA